MTFKIAKISRYHLNEFIAFLKALTQAIIDADAVKLKLDTVNNPLLSVTKNIEAAYAYQKDSPLTLEIEADDMDRDDCVVGIRVVADGFTRHFDPAIKAAANIVLTCFNKYGSGIDKLNYNAETEVVDKLIADFENDGNISAALELLGCSSWVAQLKKANNSFKGKYAARTAQFSSQPSQSALQLKPLAVDALKKLFKRIESLNNIDESNTYTNLIDYINTLITQYNTTAARRSSGGNNTPNNNQ